MSEARIRCSGVVVRRGEVQVLDGVDLDLPLQARSVLIGPNGAGKTTLLQTLHGLVRP
ncbi:MAG TPA: ATP-binding cassette domain-containing protein, partial [Quisquiliibacterium sp.]|nr:ATP-binding cassette domain-containing protein [Quisquiliibacterium sp.]